MNPSRALALVVLALNFAAGACLDGGQRATVDASATPGQPDASAGDDDATETARAATVVVSVDAIPLWGASDLCYGLEVRDGDGQRLLARGSAQGPFPTAGVGGTGGPSGTAGDAAVPLCSVREGASIGAISYAVPCSPEAPTTSVRLWVQAACERGGPSGEDCFPVQGFVNPCGADGCELVTTCRPGQDVPVAFDLAGINSVGRGFYDPFYAIDDVGCTAKVADCHYDGESLRLLFGDGGTRIRTLVAGVSCFAGAGSAAPALHLSDLALSCEDAAGTLSFADLGASETPLLPAGTLPWQVAVYYGAEELSAAADVVKKTYLTVAIGVDHAADCTLRWRVIPSAGVPAFAGPPHIDRYATTGLIAFDAVVPGDGTCTDLQFTRTQDAIRAVHNPRPDGGPFVPSEHFGAVMTVTESGAVRFDARRP